MYSASSFQPPVGPSEARIFGAPVRVTLLRRNGERISRDDDRVTKDGCIKFHRADGGKFWRQEHLELSVDSYNAAAPLLKPLFEPKIRRWDARGIVLTGWEVDVVDGKINEHRQLWHVVSTSVGRSG